MFVLFNKVSLWDKEYTHFIDIIKQWGMLMSNISWQIYAANHESGLTKKLKKMNLSRIFCYTNLHYKNTKNRKKQRNI